VTLSGAFQMCDRQPVPQGLAKHAAAGPSLVLILDTNIVLDLLHFADPAALPILDALETGRAFACVSADTLGELERVLCYPAFALDAAARAAMLARYRAMTRGVPTPAPQVHLPRCSDPDDQKFLDLAAAVEADLLITKDRALLKLARHTAPGFRIATPADAVRVLTV
jgi:putative PIN family toxin of toxin-antitoxin system